ncbi:MAG: GGDEF domain-containing protein [Gammaproteobacteria bacterium]
MTRDTQDKILPFRHGGSSTGPGRQALHIANTLQHTLELDAMLELFARAVASLLAYDGLYYEYAPGNCRFSRGKRTPYRHSCTLRLPDTDMGTVSFHRQEEFTAAELALLENLSTALLYPLRNALLYRQAVEDAARDPLTGIGNRAAMDKTLQREIELARRSAAPLSVIILDIDELKPVNDTYGHISGDTVLKTVSRRMEAQIRRSDIIYRYGGDEFLVLLRNTGIPGAVRLAERIRGAVEDLSSKHDDLIIKVTISAGVASLREDEDQTQLLKRCDEVLYAAKRAGGNCVRKRV